jgi:hypothetical protein
MNALPYLIPPAIGLLSWILRTPRAETRTSVGDLIRAEQTARVRQLLGVRP